ncbi:hypothetical protein HHK36_016249 [Tetracentron sinense]|uniref:Uncharacterized protein n=1 Tax=Tetracentron sinense TaxID=13715 RepID=A0A835DBS2_TETSI|nr:hypothetical protein HHK36_016249 [Tetracentron sinense]
MAVLEGSDVCHGEERKHEVSPLKRDHIRIKKPGLGSNAGSNSLRQKHESLLDMLLWLKEVATDPCIPRASPGAVCPLRGQILKVRKVLLPSNAEFPSKKRKLRQFLRGKSSDISELTSEKSYQQSFTGLSKGQSSSASSRACLHNITDSIRSLDQTILRNSSSWFLNFGDNFQGNQVSTDPSFQDDALDWTSSPNDDFLLSIDSDESVNGSNPSSPTKPILRDSPLLIFDDSVNSLNPSSTEKPKQLNLQTSRKSIRLLNFIGDYLPRMAIPVGPRFQADVPDWTDPFNNENPYDCDGDSDYSKWLGTQIWPIEGGRTWTIEKVIGKGRPDSCSCVSPSSVECIKHHIIKERSRLQSDLGPAFFSWKFDEMGEEVSKLWTLKEERSFKSLVKMNPIATGKSFWKPALKLFPSKCKESIVNYYFNVFVPRRMSMQTRSTSERVNSDDDEAEEAFNSMGSRKRCRAESVSFGRSKDVKTRYLIQRR